jgi:hypothetical protein
VQFKIRAIYRRTQDREPIMLEGAGNIEAPLLLAGAAAGENAVGLCAADRPCLTSCIGPAIQKFAGGSH